MRRGPRSRTAVAAVLGGDMVEQIRIAGGADSGGNMNYRETQSKERSGLDVEVLLRGAEKLCAV